MKPFRTHKGKAVALLRDNIDTDQIIPKQYLKRIERTGFGEFLFDEWRYVEGRTENPKFPLNQKKDATILIAGNNFGCGSSREHAPWALDDYGFRAILAGSFADIFYINCTKNGLLPLVLNEESRHVLSGVREEITIDLEMQEVRTSEHIFRFDIDPIWKEKLLGGLDDIAMTLQYEKEISLYEAMRA
ncbi:3-isopropylmalate dehydratase small subunit [Ectobacillus sp. JY-23]|uniref:3-isopropylmalate dehydratase small subunit n=1 Tax=Ectobacillus sp. JY-23 TaxID=2933872 RepID=UPI001FF4F5CB|nr:3-isopropylmalate dehydratase small subunit [Ectobacillus sp. JY-23]UOY93260.1 3-isopropylmalate dehydratase small subunit [Ectobacillus sp. JY-23]